jgi:hypothetical protein
MTETFARDVDMNGITREGIMAQLHITDLQISANNPIVIEKLFCAAILNQGTDFAAKTLANYNKLRDILYEVKK